MRVIPLMPTPPAAGGGDDESGHLPRLDLPLVRREFLRGSGVLIGTLATGSALALLAPSTVWAVELKLLSQAEGQALLKLGRTLYPHAKLPDAVYALLAKDLDAAASGDAATASLLKDGIAGLNRATGGSFAGASDAQRLAAFKAVEGSPFFNTVRGQCITSLYDNDMAYTVFGYPARPTTKAATSPAVSRT